MPVVDMVWKDGTRASVWNGLPVLTTLDRGLRGIIAALGISVKVAHSRLRHLTGVLGNADVPAKDEFRGRNGTAYSAVDILNGDTGTPAQAKILYDEFGASWRISQHESLFTYAHGKSTGSYTIANFPDHAFNPASAAAPPSGRRPRPPATRPASATRPCCTTASTTCWRPGTSHSRAPPGSCSRSRPATRPRRPRRRRRRSLIRRFIRSTSAPGAASPRSPTTPPPATPTSPGSMTARPRSTSAR